jgi:dihydrofolate synthase / folylpolyglutamate synthase
MTEPINPPVPPGPESIDFDALLPPFAPTDAANEWLFRLQRLGIRPGLTAIGELLDELGHPERRFPAIVVAGTNGKGSAAIALSAFCRAAGLRTGLYTSPHLLDLRERILVDGVPISAQELFALVASHRARIERIGTTFFESLTALALVHFARARVDVVVMEAGLGGRLDATNVVDKAGVLLTSVGLDHMELLGDTVEAIALEKLGLAERGVPFYVDALDEPGLDHLARRAVEEAGAIHLGLPVLTERITHEQELRAVRAEGLVQRLQTRKMLAVYRDLARRRRWPAPDLARASSLLRFPGRYEVWGSNPRLILDTAHNGHALERLCVQWEQEGSREGRILVFGTVHGKAIESAVPALLRSATTIYVTAPLWYRARDAREVAAELRAAAVRESIGTEIVVAGGVCATLEAARARAQELDRGGTRAAVMVTGSNFLVAEALDRLGVDDLLAEEHAPLWDHGAPLRRRETESEGALAR